jgi:hypothetical protein
MLKPYGTHETFRRRKMNRSILGRAALTVAVALGLGFGLQEAVASEPQRSDCTADCDRMCKEMYGNGAIGLCGPTRVLLFLTDRTAPVPLGGSYAAALSASGMDGSVGAH